MSTELRNQPLYTRILAAIAREGRSADDIAREVGCLRNAVYRALRQMRGRIVFIESYRHEGKGCDVAVWRMGRSKQNAPEPVSVAVRPEQAKPLAGAEMAAFLTTMEALADGPTTMVELVTMTGCQRSTLLRTIRLGRELGILYIAEWDRQRAQGSWAPCYALGVDQQDARKPKPMTRQQINARHQTGRNLRKRQERLLAALAGEVAA
jgi:hypothetical protein